MTLDQSQKNDGIIGVFDSGLGGLTVLRALVERLPGESTVYLGDTARVPYGTKSAAVVTRYALNIASHLARYPLKAMVVACNTASAVALPALREQLNIPVLGVVEPGSEAAITGSPGKRIAVLATTGTIRSGAYHRALVERAPGVEVIGRPCPLFVPLAEEGLVEGPIVDLACQRYLSDLAPLVDTAILGCTHYPLLAAAIGNALGPGVAIIDSADATAASLRDLLAEHDLCAPGRTIAEHRFIFTDAADNTAELASLFFGGAVDHFDVVDL